MMSTIFSEFLPLVWNPVGGRSLSLSLTHTHTHAHTHTQLLTHSLTHSLCVCLQKMCPAQAMATPSQLP